MNKVILVFLLVVVAVILTSSDEAGVADLNTRYAQIQELRQGIEREEMELSEQIESFSSQFFDNSAQIKPEPLDFIVLKSFDFVSGVPYVMNATFQVFKDIGGLSHDICRHFVSNTASKRNDSRCISAVSQSLRCYRIEAVRSLISSNEINKEVILTFSYKNRTRNNIICTLSHSFVGYN